MSGGLEADSGIESLVLLEVGLAPFGSRVLGLVLRFEPVEVLVDLLDAQRVEALMAVSWQAEETLGLKFLAIFEGVSNRQYGFGIALIVPMKPDHWQRSS